MSGQQVLLCTEHRTRPWHLRGYYLWHVEDTTHLTTDFLTFLASVFTNVPDSILENESRLAKIMYSIFRSARNPQVRGPWEEWAHLHIQRLNCSIFFGGISVKANYPAVQNLEVYLISRYSSKSKPLAQNCPIENQDFGVRTQIKNVGKNCRNIFK